MHQRSDRETADQVDDERAVGKGTTESLCCPEGDQIARARADGACQADPDAGEAKESRDLPGRTTVCQKQSRLQ